jgi:(S)-2-hydroxyglutarate dehydrogenase
VTSRPDVVVVGGGIIGLATAYSLLGSSPGLDVVVMEKEAAPAAHQSGRNSGVIHSGVYYRPGSLKARTVAAGRQALVEFCRANGVPTEIVGKVIVAVDEPERDRLRDLKGRADANGVPAELIDRRRLADLEPHAAGVAALHVPGAGVVDFAEVCRALARLLEAAGNEFRPGTRVRTLTERGRRVVVSTDGGEVEARVAVNCAGLHSDLLAAGSGGRPGSLRIVPFRGEFHRLVEGRRHLVRSMIYPVPDVRFPFLGVHFTRGVGGEVHAGPNAVLALAREGYSWRTVDASDTWDLLRYPGFRRLAARHWRTGAGEVVRSLSRSAFVAALQRLVPDVGPADLEPCPAGVRAQAVDRRGALVDDFVVEESRRTVHVLNAPSPAATASLEVGRIVAQRVLERL